MPYIPINTTAFTLAFDSALAGMVQAGRGEGPTTSLGYDPYVAGAAAWAQAIDLALNDASALDTVQAGIILQGSFGFWGVASRVSSILSSPPPTFALYLRQAAELIASITSAENYYTAQGITPPPWGGGGGGSTIPTVPGAGDVLTSTAAGSPSPSTMAWIPPGGFAITSFTGVNGSFDLGQSRASFTWASTQNGIPTAASITWAGVATGTFNIPGGSLGLSMGGTINGPFVGNANGNTLTVTLHCTFADGSTKTSTQTITWEYRVSYLGTGDTAGNIASADAAYVLANWTQFELRESRGGTYDFAPTGSNFGPIALPTALGAGSWTAGSFGVSPTFVQTIADYVNPYGITYSIDVYQWPNAANDYTWS